MPNAVLMLYFLPTCRPLVVPVSDLPHLLLLFVAQAPRSGDISRNGCVLLQIPRSASSAPWFFVISARARGL